MLLGLVVSLPVPFRRVDHYADSAQHRNRVVRVLMRLARRNSMLPGLGGNALSILPLQP